MSENETLIATADADTNVGDIPIVGNEINETTEDLIKDKSIAVLPFKNLSDDQSNQYFADGVMDVIINHLSRIEEYEPSPADPALCPACQTTVGEYHILGCPVEICPWCSGQLTRCNCRFTWLEVENIDRESQIEKLQERLDAEGRIPFAKEHSPAYASDKLNDESEKTDDDESGNGGALDSPDRDQEEVEDEVDRHAGEIDLHHHTLSSMGIESGPENAPVATHGQSQSEGLHHEDAGQVLLAEDGEALLWYRLPVRPSPLPSQSRADRHRRHVGRRHHG